MHPFTRKAEADWKGNLDQGHGLVTTESKVLVEQPFSFKTRVAEGDKSQTNPEELIAAAVSSCFSMALSKTLQDDGVIAQQLVVTASVTAGPADDGLKVSGLKLEVAGMVGDYTEDQFKTAVATTQKNCPVYKLLEPGFETIDVQTVLRN